MGTTGRCIEHAISIARVISLMHLTRLPRQSCTGVVNVPKLCNLLVKLGLSSFIAIYT